VNKTKGFEKNAGFFSVVLCVTMLLPAVSFASNLDKLKTYFLNAKYDEAIKEGENILSRQGYSRDMDELYYLLGLSYLKVGNFLRASDIFEIILREFKESGFKAEAKLGLGDTYFLRGNFTEAEQQYQEILDKFPEANLKAALYFRLNQIAVKKGDTQQAQNYAERLKQECPLSPEVRIDKDIVLADFFYTVQVGSFSKSLNAQNLVKKLKTKGYAAYLEKFESAKKTNFRVRVGKVNSRKEAEALVKKLALEGYPTKIFP
jgi:tetratricopeptide (TPR) repeat protein